MPVHDVSNVIAEESAVCPRVAVAPILKEQTREVPILCRTHEKRFGVSKLIELVKKTRLPEYPLMRRSATIGSLVSSQVLKPIKVRRGEFGAAGHRRHSSLVRHAFFLARRCVPSPEFPS